LSDVLDRYVENYQRIATVHVDHWRQTGRNPFQDPTVLKQNENATVRLVRKHAKPRGYLLDAGCGMGNLMLRFPKMHVSGVEIASAYLEVAAERKLAVENAFLESLPWEPEVFDTVVCTDVLEHVLDVNVVVRELLRVLCPGGMIVARVPDMEPVAWSGQAYEFVHLRIFDEGTLRLLFGLIFDMDVVECGHDGNTIHIVARKP
jgi:2-polyprenyl-3-methyl-5-hydroxy-6-metoxy-1,4-benzoquinol methylase